jgi:uncharacterized protein
MIVIPPSSGTAFELRQGQLLTVIDPHGEQVADMLAFSSADTREVMSSGRTFDYLGKLFMTKGDAIYSNRSNEMLRILADSVGRHDFLLTPCSADTFRLLYAPDSAPVRGCFENLTDSLSTYGITADSVPTAFNIFMNVEIDSDGKLLVSPPRSRAGDSITFHAVMDLVIGLTACSAPMSNNGTLKPIHYAISTPAPV